MGPCDCSNKNGCMNMLATLSMTAAWCFNVAAFSVCRFVSNENGFFEAPGNQNQGTVKYVGLYTMEINEVCYAINWNEVTGQLTYWTDSKLNSARACGGCAALFGIIFMIWMWCAMCCNCGRVKCVRKIFGFFALVCAILSGLMFLIYQSYLCNGANGTDCGFSQGGGFTVAALVLYFFASVLCCAAPDADEDEDEPVPSAAAASGGGTTTVTVEKTTLEDGTVVEKKTTTHPDGSKTVEETKVEPVPEGPMDNEADEEMPKAQVN